MKNVLTPQQMQAADAYTQETIFLPGMVLMERAALACCEQIKQIARPQDTILCVCGRGNNGGDGIAIARLLHCDGYHTEVFFYGEDAAGETLQGKHAGTEHHATSQNMEQLAIAHSLGVPVTRGSTLPRADVIVDALFGVGLSRDLREDMARLVDQINQSGAAIVSVDMPSGIDGETGQIRGAAVKADLTVTFQFYKRGQLLYPGRAYCGELYLCDVGIVLPYEQEGRSEEGRTFCAHPVAKTLAAEDLPRLLPARMARSNKGSYGRLLLFAGTKNMAGAAAMSARAALRCGCGLVEIVSDEANREILQTLVPEAIFSPFPICAGLEKEDLAAWLKERLKRANAVAAGPGLGENERTGWLVGQLLEECDVPLLLDADALNVIAKEPALRDALAKRTGKQEGDPGTGSSKARGGRRCSKVIITPHPGEMMRLTGTPVKELMLHPVQTAMAFAQEHQLVCVLKDAATVVTDGEALYLNRSGCDGMATGGSGDVLSGIIGSLLAQDASDVVHLSDRKQDSDRALLLAALGVFLHGLAGETAQERYGARGMTAMDLPDALAQVLHQAKSIRNHG